MKKVILVAAVAMLALASCNKDENQVTLRFGGENYATNDKQAYAGSSLYFTNNDPIYVNGHRYTVEVPSTDTVGATAKVRVNRANSYDVYYGNGVQVDSATGVASVVFNPQVTLIPNYTRTELNGAQSWPMFARVVDPTAHFTIKNVCTVLSPCVKYGIEFAQFMWENNGFDPWPVSAAEGWVATPDNLPTLNFTKVEFTCEQRILAGTGTINVSRPAYPRVVMQSALTGDPDEGHKITVIVNPVYECAATGSNDNATSYQFGNIAMAPLYCDTDEGAVINVAYYFNVTMNGQTRYYVYRGAAEPVSLGFQYVCGKRMFFQANLFQRSGADWVNKVARLTE